MTDTILRDALGRIASGLLREGSVLLATAVASDPASAETAFNEGLAYHRANELGKALAVYDALLGSAKAMQA